jgi:gas vesicle protein
MFNFGLFIGILIGVVVGGVAMYVWVSVTGKLPGQR